MALDLTTYVSAADYRTRVGDASTGADTLLDADLLATCRLLEKSLGVVPGAFNSSASETFTFDGVNPAASRIWLRDAAGMGFYLESIAADGVKLDTEQDGTFDGESYDPATADTWITLGPVNAAAFGEPGRYVDILQHRTDRARDCWPTFPQSIKITGSYGWPAVPEAIAAVVAHRCNELREGLKAGAIDELAGFDAGIPMQKNTFWLWREIEQQYGRQVWTF